jgi:hypothetical protein
LRKGVLRRISGLEDQKISGGRRKLHNEELRNLHALPNVIRMIKSRRMKLVGDEAH